jgi:Holliday junction resolvase RusA-like endonuclease
MQVQYLHIQTEGTVTTPKHTSDDSTSFVSLFRISSAWTASKQKHRASAVSRQQSPQRNLNIRIQIQVYLILSYNKKQVSTVAVCMVEWMAVSK